MRFLRTRWGRVATLALAAGIVIGMLLINPASGHFTTNTQHLGKHAWQQFIKQKSKNLFVEEKKLLSATVDNAGQAGAVLVRGRGAVSVAGFIATQVRFNRPVRKCAWTATVETGTDARIATVQAGTTNKDVNVWIWNDAGAFALGDLFHLTGVCP